MALCDLLELATRTAGCLDIAASVTTEVWSTSFVSAQSKWRANVGSTVLDTTRFSAVRQIELPTVLVSSVEPPSLTRAVLETSLQVGVAGRSTVFVSV